MKQTKIAVLGILSLVLTVGFIYPASFFDNNNVVDASSVTAASFHDSETGEVLVKFKGEEMHQKFDYGSNELAVKALNRWQKQDAVTLAQPNYIYQAAVVPSDPLLMNQSHLEIIQARQAWEITASAKDVVIALIDSGVDIDHPDLRQNIWTNPNDPVNGIDDDGNGKVDDVYGWDFLLDSADPRPKFPLGTPENSIGIQHGTMVAGIIAAQGNNGIGVSGVAWEAAIMSLRVLNQYGSGNSDTVTTAMQYAMQHDIDIINLSLVGTNYDPLVVNMLNEAYQQGIIVVAAAGNNGTNLNAIDVFPACYNHLGSATVIGVGAIDNDYSRPSFTNYGHDCVDIVAPGVKIFSTRVVEPSFTSQDLYAATFSGTSFAAPQVTGVVALMKQLRPSLTSDEVLLLLQEGALQIDSGVVAGAGFDYSLNAAGSLALVEAEDIGSGYVNALLPEFVVFPLGEFGTSAYQYQMPGPILLTPLVFDGDLLSKGMRWVRHTPFTSLVSAWRPGNKVLMRYNFLSQRQENLIEVDVMDEQTVGEIAIGNVDFDPTEEVVIAAGPQSKPLISVYTIEGLLKYQIQVYDDAIDGGVDIALIDRNDDNVMEMVVVPVSQTDGHIKIYEYTGLLLDEWHAFENFDGGATINAGDIDQDGVFEILVGAGASGSPHIKVFNVSGDLVTEFMAGDSSERGGAHVIFDDFDRDFSPEYVVSYKEGHSAVIRMYGLDGSFVQELGVMDGKYQGGVGVMPL